MKHILNWVLVAILVILVPIFLAGAVWQIGGEALAWLPDNWLLAALLVGVVWQGHRIRKLEQAVQWLNDELEQAAKYLVPQ